MNLTCNITSQANSDLLITIYSLVLIVGVPTNVLTLFLTFAQIRKKNVLAVYLFTLTVSDLFYMTTIPLWIHYVMNDNKWHAPESLCKIAGFIFFNNLYISILILCCISVDRYIAVVYSLESRGKRRQKRAWIICAFVWMLVMIAHIPVFTLKDKKQNSESCFENFPLSPVVASLSIVRFCIGFIVPLVTLSITNIKVFQAVKASGGSTSRQINKVRYLAIFIITIFLCCFAPYHCLLLSRAVVSFLSNGVKCDFEETIYSYYTVFLCLCTVNSAINPILYIFSSENCRQELRRGLRCLGNVSNHSNKSESMTLATPRSRQQQQ